MIARVSPVVDGMGEPIDGLRFVRDLAGIRALETEWLRLEAQQEAEQAGFFQSYAWVEHVARIRVAADPAFGILVAVVVEGGRVRFIWPLALVRQGGVAQAVMLDDSFGQFAGCLVEPGADAVVFVKQVVAALTGLADGLRVAQLPITSPLRIGLLAAGARVVSSQPSVVVDLGGFASFAEFQQSTSSKVRKILRNARNRLERAHETTPVSGTDTALVSEALSYAFTERVAWMKRNGRFTAAFQNPVFRTIVEEASQAGLPCLGFCLMAGPRVASAQFGFHYRGRYYAYLSALNPDFEEFSAGRLHLGMVIDDCFRRGLKVLELMPPAVRYKLEWNGVTKDLDTLSLALSFRGRVLFTILDRVLPALRRLSRHVPEIFRRPLVNLFNRN
jgi:CelD/BcsL family acetyltransferase involved in cellulose biosynthesis